MKKQYGRKPSGDKPAWKKSGAGAGKSSFPKKRFSSDKPSFDKKDSSDRGERKFGDKPFSKKPYAGKSEGGERKFGDKPFSKKPYAGKSEGGERKFGDKPFVKKPYGDREDRGERKFGDKPFVKKPYGDREDRGERKFSDKPFAKKPYAGKPDYDKKSSSGRSEGGERKFGDKPFSKKPYAGKAEGGERKFGDKPFVKKPYGERDGGGDKPYGKKPYGSKAGSFEKPAYTKTDSYGKPFKKKYGPDRKQTRSADAPVIKRFGENIKDEDWQVFENAEDAKNFIKENRGEKKSSSASAPKEFQNDVRPLRAKRQTDETAVRLNRFIANTGICSRREADDLIEAGVVKVNGKIVTELGTKVGPNDTIHYGDQLLRREKMVYVLLNKPKDYITTTDDPQERKTVMSLIEEACKERVYPVGRLDRNTTGLLLFTNDGDLAERLTHPKNGVRKIYHVSLDKNLKTDDFEKILKGFDMEDGFMQADELSFVGDGTDKKEVGIVIHSGRNRIVRRIFETLGYDVIKLDRVVYAGLTKKNLPRGKFRHLTTEEVGIMRMQIGGEKKFNFKKADEKHTKGKRTPKEK